MIRTSHKVRKYHPDTRECYFSNEKYLRYFKQYTPSNCRLECSTNLTEHLHQDLRIWIFQYIFVFKNRRM
ncbi:unnamed protein product [Acanthoscelides obtectus]|uniref:Uncharacterized protein n=1 Tax=Acanthoscelides obtectus TaxID=200917 RepID=A0A9P0P906_ACAOB|nr:unnamed protein product [Acanthoscelides obtectus]CAK1635293.1 hypothetical protein AOBTE_LOCUS9181 [Acanthoscelides obtectus]